MFKHVYLWAIIILALGLAACNGENDQPQATAAPPPTVDPVDDQGYPETQPDLAHGAAIFAEHCADCHGSDGQGDGPQVQNGRVSDPGNFHAPDHSTGQSPDDYFNMITNGHTNPIKPFYGTLTEAKRWDVALYTYTLHYQAQQLSRGAEVYAQECARCHGETGDGDGPDWQETTRTSGAFTDPVEMALLSDDNMRIIITEGAGSKMPDFGDDLNEEDINAVVAFARSFSLQNGSFRASDTAGLIINVAQSVDPTQEPTEIPPEPVIGTINGLVIQGTAGMGMPAGSIVTLHIFDEQMNEETREAAIDAEGNYHFGDVLVSTEYAYFTSMTYAGRDFASPAVLGDPTQPEVSLPITIYETTDDPSVIQIVAMVTQITEHSEFVEVVHMVRFNNTSDRLYTTNTAITVDDAEYPEQYVSVTVPLPIGAMPIPSNETRYGFDQDDYVLFDTRAVIPNDEHLVQISYLMPLDRAAILEYPVNYAVNGTLRVLTEGDTLQLESEQLPYLGEETIGEQIMNSYGAELQLQPGDLISYRISGNIGPHNVTDDTNAITGDALPLVFGGIIVLVIILIVVIFFIQSRSSQQEDSQSNPAQLIDGYTQQIAELDAQHDRGEINHDLYHQRRQELQTRLDELMEENNTP